MGMSELDAARFVRAALGLIHRELPDGSEVRAVVGEFMSEVDAYAETQDAPPWTAHEAFPERPAVWSEVLCSDFVLAPNGQWYEVDSMARKGDWIRALLKVGTDLVPTTRTAAEAVQVRRGPNGQAADVLASAFSVEVIRS